MIDALKCENDRQYAASIDAWLAVLQYNNNFDSAYIGVGRAYYRQGNAYFVSEDGQSYYKQTDVAVYGGAVENSVADGPGDLDMMNADELTTRYLLPESHLPLVQEGASLVHLMNNNIFTAAVFKLTDSQRLNTVAKDLRDNVQQNRWICGQPDKLLIADMGDGQLLMVFGSNDAMDGFRTNMTKVYPNANILYSENILA